MNPPNWKTYLHKEKELQGPSEKQQEIYNKAGLTESDVAFFREKMNRAKTQIQQIEAYTKQNNKIEAIAKAPKETWDKPSPIKEKRFNTKVTPNKEEQSAIKTPTIKAYCTNG